MSARVLCVGLTTVDLVYSGLDRPILGIKSQVDTATIAAGGPAANAAIAAAALGGDVALCTAADDGPFAAIAVAELRAHGVEVLAAGATAMPISTVLVERGGERTVISANGVGQSPGTPPQLTAVAANSPVILVDGHYPNLALAALESGRSAGATTVIDLGSWKESLPRLLPHCDIAIASGDFTTGSGDTFADLFAYGVGFAAVSHGSQSIQWRTASGESGIVPVPQVDVVSTNGAGDVLHGAFARFVARGDDVIDALAQAAHVASASCTHEPARVITDSPASAE